MPLMIQGVQTMVNLALDINKALGRRQIVNIDIGGGLSVNFDDERNGSYIHSYTHIHTYIYTHMSFIAMCNDNNRDGCGNFIWCIC